MQKQLPATERADPFAKSGHGKPGPCPVTGKSETNPRWRLVVSDLDGTLLGNPEGTRRFKTVWTGLPPDTRPLLVYNSGRLVDDLRRFVDNGTLPGNTVLPDYFRLRNDIVDGAGKVTLRHAGVLHHIGLGRRYARQPIRMLIRETHIRVITTDGELITELTLDPANGYQPQ